MKKITFIITFGAISAIIYTDHADSYQYTPYVGLDYVYNQTSGRGFSPRYHTGGIHFGSTYSPYFATELFFNQSGHDTKHLLDHKVKSSYRAYGLDLLAKLPLGCEKSFALIATAGFGEYVFRHKILSQKHHNENGYGYRFGGGMQYAFNSHWQARFLTRFVNFDHVSGYDHDVEYNLSLEYLF